MRAPSSNRAPAEIAAMRRRMETHFHHFSSVEYREWVRPVTVDIVEATGVPKPAVRSSAIVGHAAARVDLEAIPEPDILPCTESGRSDGSGRSRPASARYQADRAGHKAEDFKA